MESESRFINPFTDYGFKRLFGTEANKALLIDFLNQLLPEKHQIADLHYAQNEHFGLNEKDRKAVFDVYCISRNGDRFIAELQRARQAYFKDRSVFYASFPIQEQGQTNDWNFQLAAVYTVAILNFTLAENRDMSDVVSVVQLKDQHGRVFYDKLTFIYLEMPKFTKSISQLETQADKWQYIFKNLERLRKRPPEIKEQIFQQLFDAAEVAKFGKTERARYEQSLKHYRDLNNVLDYAEQEGRQTGYEQGIEAGRQVGLQEGIKEGIKEGLQKGREEGMYEQTINIARNALAAGMSVADIAKLTGLSELELQQLAAS
ncbi:Rpn family recombination-promoting nuclease/putative transposase [Spirosoma gilvum]